MAASKHNPVTPTEWQEAVDAAHVLLLIDSAWKYKLIVGGPTVNVERCQEILRRGTELGVKPSTNAVERLLQNQAGPVDTTVRCRACHATQRVNYARCLRESWPMCHGASMSIVASSADVGEAVGAAMAALTTARRVFTHPNPQGRRP